MGLLRRFVLLCLVACLPLQGSWAAVAGPCVFDSPCAGQHPDPTAAHEADAAPGADVADDAAAAPSPGSPCGGDCVNCHGPLLPALLGAAIQVPGLEGAPGRSGYARHVTDPVPRQALRPPLSPQA